MRAVQIPITSGAAGGTLVTRVESNHGKLLGFIRVVNIDWTPTLGMGTYYAVQQCYNNHFNVAMFTTLYEAYRFLGVSSKELDASELGKYCYDERNDRYFQDTHNVLSNDDLIQAIYFAMGDGKVVFDEKHLEFIATELVPYPVRDSGGSIDSVGYEERVHHISMSEAVKYWEEMQRTLNEIAPIPSPVSPISPLDEEYELPF